MKKTIVILLALVMLLSLAACGGTAENPYAKYEELFNYLEAKDYESAGAYIQKLAENGADAQNTDTAEPSTAETEPSYTTVEITLDNWQDYFEIKPMATFNKNAFGEVEAVFRSWYFCLKESWADSVAAADVALEYSCTDGYYCWYTHNLETGEVVQGETIESSNHPNDLSGTASFNDYDLKEDRYPGFPSYLNNCSELWYDTNSTYSSIEDNTVIAYGSAYSNIEIVRIQGTLTIAD